MSLKKSRITKSHIINKVAILDAGGQYVDLVHKAVIRLGIPAKVLDLATSRDILEAQYGAVIISGSPVSSYQEKAPQPDMTLWDSALPILGICYGMQSMTVAHGGKVATNVMRQDGRITTQIDIAHPIFSGSKKDFTALFTHGDFVTELPAGFTAIGQHILSNGSTAYSAIAHGNKIGVQFHPEVFDDTPGGYQIFSNFLMEIAGLQKDILFNEEQLDRVIELKRQEIKKQVAGRHVIAFVSGGVDSSVAATLASTVVSEDKFHAYYIDNGFMRDEDEMVIDALRAAGIAVSKVDAVKKFENAEAMVDGVLIGPLKYVVDPEAKRKIIGKAFIETQNDILKNLKLQEALLLQGTNAADRIESGGSKGGVHTMTIKTHHNQVLEVQELKARGLLLEPLDDLFKDEVRALGRELGLSFELVERQPFPGPGLAIRIIAALQNKDKLQEDPISKAINIYIAECKFDTLKAITAHVLPIRSVGVGGDERSHISVAAIGNAGLSAGDLSALATGIPANFRGRVNRVIYALGPQPLKNHYITKTLLTEAARKQLRQADRIVFEEMRSADLLGKIKQMPVVLLPLSFGASGSRSIVLRPVNTNTFMTVQAMLPGRDLPENFFENVTRRILKEVPGISQVFLDLTNKPPATTEWE